MRDVNIKIKLFPTCFGCYSAMGRQISFIVASCILKTILLTNQQIHYLLNLENLKFTLSTHRYLSYMFRSTTIIRELVLNLAKVIFMLKHAVKLRRYMLIGDVAACHKAACVLCAVLRTAHNTQITK